jgi:hypothetical protein
MTQITHITRISSDGKIPKRISEDIKNFFELMKGKPVEIKLTKISDKRSDLQNKYLHVILALITDELNKMGNEFRMSEIKELLKAKFLLIDVVNEKTGECIGQRIKGTHECSKEEIGLFIDNIIEWALQFNITVPPPLTQLTLNT